MAHDQISQHMFSSIRRIVARREGEAIAVAVERACEPGSNPLGQDTDLSVLRALTIMLQLANLAEMARPEEADAALKALRAELGSLHADDPDTFDATVQSMNLELVLTAHPTEIKRQSIQNTERDIFTAAVRMDTDAGSKALDRAVLTLWNTSQSRGAKLSITDEIVNGAGVLSRSILPAATGLMKALESQPTSRVIRFASWIGGDRDGNPFVDGGTLGQAVQQHASAILNHYLDLLLELEEKLSLDDAFLDIPGPVKFLASQCDTPPAHYATESFRRALMGIRQKLEQVLKGVCVSQASGNDAHPPSYSSTQFGEDLRTLSWALTAMGLEALYCDDLNLLAGTADLFGFHLASIDLRQNSSKHEALITELLQLARPGTDYATLNEETRIALLTEFLNTAQPLWDSGHCLSDEAGAEVDVFQTAMRMRRLIGPKVISNSIISNTESVSDVLELAVLLQEFGLFGRWVDNPVFPVPLFETIDDLRRAPDIMNELLSIPAYCSVLKAHGGCQQVMLGYSDSNKDGGIVAARWEVAKAEAALNQVIKGHGFSARFFHGRGGSIGRGSGTVAAAIAAQPSTEASLKFRVTEQGEVLSRRFANPHQTTLHLCEMISATARFGMSLDKTGKSRRTGSEETAVLEQLSRSSYKCYRDLVKDTPGFITFMRQATILEHIGSLNMGSRPVSRGKIGNLSQLRAIPWVFSWGQSRFMLPAWYGFGGAVAQMSSEDRRSLSELYQSSDLFQGLIDGMALAMSKADMIISSQYADLVKDRSIRVGVLKKIQAEWALTRIALGEVQQTDLDARNPEFEQRRQMVAQLNNAQIALLRALRLNPEDTDLQNALKLTVNGIAAGLQHTG